MPLARLRTVAFLGLDALSVDVEVDAQLAEERQTLVIVGLPDTVIKESRDRVLSALRNSNFNLPPLHATINLAPAQVRKEGMAYDLPIALGLLQALGKLGSESPVQDFLIAGELSLNGDLRPIKGGLALALQAREKGLKGVLVPYSNAAEAAIVPGIAVIPVKNLTEAAAFLANPTSIVPLKTKHLSSTPSPVVDFASIKGQGFVKRALEIAAAGEHNVLMWGPPGSGKTLLSRSLPGIMPDLTWEEALVVTRIHSIAGILPPETALLQERPFRAPHHTISGAGLVGGGANPRPGEVSLAHHGILFLDELTEFPRQVLELLRQPLEDRKVHISRARTSVSYPTHFLCIAAFNPCPCGYLGHPDKPCKDTPAQVQRYQGKVSGPLRDRFDIHLEVSVAKFDELHAPPQGESSALVKRRVESARALQKARYGKEKTNSQLNLEDLERFAPLSTSALAILRQAAERNALSARAIHRLHRVARTIADLEGASVIGEEHILEAVHFR